MPGDWYLDETKKVPVKLTKFTTEGGTPAVTLIWNSSYSGEFTLWFGTDKHEKNFTKTIVVESLF